ncbi:hypothetical protein F511_38369 [Dorcoceras hygrometricum]|uniref:Uncharacterized protein n=1 Tax=Dorcoceras hygrometricum TaxID=472368 RepID=A0A2Z7BUI5_9LAMI|nr:hypothetical protein F511_38369 [Dorcoceras hygrometricum]
MSSSHNKFPMFSKEEHDDWKIRMQEHIAAQNDDMWYVITDGPMKIMKANTAMDITEHIAAQNDDMWYVITDGPMKIMKANTAMDITVRPRANY